MCRKGNISRYVASTMNRQRRLNFIFISTNLKMAIMISCMTSLTSTKVVLASGQDVARKAKKLIANGCSKRLEENIEAAQE